MNSNNITHAQAALAHFQLSILVDSSGRTRRHEKMNEMKVETWGGRSTQVVGRASRDCFAKLHKMLAGPVRVE